MQLEQIVAKLREDYNVAGMSVALIKNGEIVSVEGYGVRDAAENLPMTKDTVMPIGSVTKTFTSLALAMLADEGKLDWDEPVRTYIPWLKLNNEMLTENVTARDLMCHRTGTPKYDLQAISRVFTDIRSLPHKVHVLQSDGFARRISRRCALREILRGLCERKNF